MKIYLAGAINGCTYSECNDWRDMATRLLAGRAMTINPMRRDYRGREDLHVKEIVELDKADIMAADKVLVSYTKPSVGTSMEVLFAWEHDRPVVVFTDAENVSPWLRYHAQAIVGTLEEAVNLL